MDLGVLRRSRTAFWSWIVLPALCLASSQYALSVYSRYVNEDLARRESLLTLMPDMRGRLVVANDIVEGFASVSVDEAAAIESFGSKLSEMAQQYGLILNSVRVEKSETAQGTAEAALRVVLKGEGSLVAFGQFLDKLQGPQSLVTVESAELSGRVKEGRLGYEGQFVFLCHTLAD